MTGKSADFAAIIPLFNKGPDVGAALASVLAQTHPVSEIIVVDDASTDDGAAVVAACADPRLRLLRRSTPGPGGYAARNLGIASSRARWLAFLDADDLWAADHIASLAALAEAHPAAGCVATRYDHVFANRREADRIAGPVAAAAAAPAGGRIALGAFLESWLAAGHCPLWTGALAIRRDVLERSGGFPIGVAERGGDKDLWLRVLNVADLAFSGKSTASFRREAADKLTDRVDTRRVPCLVATAREIGRSAAPRERRLLRRLMNQEIGLYARWTARDGGRPAIGLRDMAWPPAPAPLATLLAARLLPGALLRGAYRWEHRRRARGRTS
ncbi:MAG TPA: glycosyltransferase family A protein [Sphingomonas sp.]|jgi:glycosyltransferase involved in cell wall biosynthesis|nr:glycosyltransferase family A protein [Sphingomonas sp.]